MQNYTSLTQVHIAYFQSFLEPSQLIIEDKELLQKYGKDETEDLLYTPEIVLFPTTTQQVSTILAYCYDQHIAVTPRGAGTGLSGGALPVCSGVVVAMAKMNKILEIDTNNLQVIVEPGVITQVLQDAVIEKGLFYPPDPASKGSCFIGGNIAHGSGGPRALKYGVTKDYVLNLEVVLANGSIIHTGARTLKNSTGYNLTQLMVGSEGTLGIVTKIYLKLIPYPTQRVLLLASFDSLYKACEAVSSFFIAGIVPSAVEFMERNAVDWVVKYIPEITVSLPESAVAFLLIEVDGNELDTLYKQAEQINTILEQYECIDVLLADTEAQKEQLWKLRRTIGEAVKANSVYKEEDSVVMRASLPQLITGVKSIGDKYKFESVCYGHAGDGNLHINIIKGNLTQQQWNEEIPQAIREIFELCKQLGGTISGEHGIGWVQKEYMDIIFPAHHLQLLSAVKNAFDPTNILNPNKIVPAAFSINS